MFDIFLFLFYAFSRQGRLETLVAQNNLIIVHFLWNGLILQFLLWSASSILLVESESAFPCLTCSPKQLSPPRSWNLLENFSCVVCVEITLPPANGRGQLLLQGCIRFLFDHCSFEQKPSVAGLNLDHYLAFQLATLPPISLWNVVHIPSSWRSWI